ncbi:MAG: hypothetical protein OHK006_06670 [Thermodesulfovibrionales bacterium]
MQWQAEAGLVRDAIASGFTNPTEAAFRKEVRRWKPEVIQDGIRKCEQLRANLIHTQGANAPVIRFCDKASAMVQKPERSTAHTVLCANDHRERRQWAVHLPPEEH